MLKSGTNAVAFGQYRGNSADRLGRANSSTTVHKIGGTILGSEARGQSCTLINGPFRIKFGRQIGAPDHMHALPGCQ